MRETSLSMTTRKITDLQQNLKDTNCRIDLLRMASDTFEEELYQQKLRLSHLERIYQLAAQEFSRLRREKDNSLTNEDVGELEKWIGRAKSSEGLKDIVDALIELRKYKPVDIKSNLYALVQRIIIGGAYHQNK